MRVSLKELEVFSQCPAKSHFSRTEGTPHNFELDIVNSVIKKCYLKSTELGFRAEWRRIVGWVDKMAFKDIDISIPDSYKVGKSTSEHCLTFLRTWYEAIYLKEDVIGYCDLELEMDLDRHVITGVAPIVKTDGEDIQILEITDKPRENKQLFNSLEARGLCLLLSKRLIKENINYVSICLGERGGFKVAEIKTNLVDHVRLVDNLTYITTAYEKDFSYPSVSEQCSTCPYKWRCSL